MEDKDSKPQLNIEYTNNIVCEHCGYKHDMDLLVLLAEILHSEYCKQCIAETIERKE
jgi:hypothetical protein